MTTGMDFSAWAENNKALWARVYDEVIAPDLEKEWKKRTRPWFTSNNRDLISAGIEIHDAESKKSMSFEEAERSNTHLQCRR